ncbi:histamine H3 receptor-like isoform X2 [Gigantopelta aegis]|uniref:histamine H3 receptor-like isoform X2 n=1 Tax=Gigantopelta aegis TaxID=1735272 RepID=UPI001B88A1CA|nr:histamine H3 receptor-like isoform X2 [Gigantopelta aegis]
MSFNISPSTEEPDKEDIHLLPTPVLVPVVIIMAIIILTTVIGNLLIITSYLRDRSLRTSYNIYIFNLAIADMLIGFNSMSLYTAYTIKGFYWPLGRAMCKIFLCVDFTLCLETVLMIIVLSLDRLILITTGDNYSETRRMAYIKVTASWIFAFSVYGPAIIGWNYRVGKSVIVDGVCDTEFNKNFEYILATATVEFVIPFVSIIVLNTLIYLKIRKSNKISDRRKSSTPTQVLTGVFLTNATSGDWNNQDRSPVNGINQGCISVNDPSSADSNASGNNPGSVSENNPQRTDWTIPGNTGGDNPHRTDGIIPGNIGGDKPDITGGTIRGNIGGDNPHRTDGTIPGNISGNNPHITDGTIPGNIGGDNAHRTDGNIAVSADANNSNSVCGNVLTSVGRQNRERNAAKTLLLLVMVFAVCWTPYTVATIVKTLCEACVDKYAYAFFIWLLWTKSCVNPFLYAYTCDKFRKNFKLLLLCPRKKS